MVVYVVLGDIEALYVLRGLGSDHMQSVQLSAVPGIARGVSLGWLIRAEEYLLG